MNFDNFTIKSQEAIQMAVDTVRRNGGQVVEPEHLLKAVIVKGESVVKFIFQSWASTRKWSTHNWRK